MKVIAINTSAERDMGIVSLLLDPFLDGLRDSGAAVELFYADGGIPGHRREICEVDILVIASPLFFDGRTGPEGATPVLRQLLERLSPGTQMSACRPYGHTVRTVREDVDIRKVIIPSGSGFWDIDAISPTAGLITALCDSPFPEFAGNIPETRSMQLRGAMPRGLLDWDIFSAAREAGCQLAQEEVVPPTPHDIARREAVTRDFYGQILNGNLSGKAAPFAVQAATKCTQK